MQHTKSAGHHCFNRAAASNCATTRLNSWNLLTFLKNCSPLTFTLWVSQTSAPLFWSPAPVDCYGSEKQVPSRRHGVSTRMQWDFNFIAETRFSDLLLKVKRRKYWSSPCSLERENQKSLLSKLHAVFILFHLPAVDLCTGFVVVFLDRKVKILPGCFITDRFYIVLCCAEWRSACIPKLCTF